MVKRHTGRMLAPVLVLAAVSLPAQQGRGGAQFPGGTNPDGSLRPSAPVTRLFTQDAYTSTSCSRRAANSFASRFCLKTRAGATELINATRSGSEGPGHRSLRSAHGQAAQVHVRAGAERSGDHMIRAQLPIPVPEGGIGRVLIYKTYKDARTYMMNGDEIVWVRSLSGYRLGVILPKGYAFISSNIAAQLSTTARWTVEAGVCEPERAEQPVTMHAHRRPPCFTRGTYTDMFFDDIKTLYDLRRPGDRYVHGGADVQGLPQRRDATIDAMRYLALQDVKVDRPRHGEAATVTSAEKRPRRSKCRSRRQTERALENHRHRDGPATRSRMAKWCSSGRCKGCATRCCCRRDGK